MKLTGRNRRYWDGDGVREQMTLIKSTRPYVKRVRIDTREPKAVQVRDMLIDRGE